MMINSITKDEFGTSAPIAQNRLLGAGMGGLVVLSLFDGMSCGQLALKKAGIKVKQYYAAEIDKYAIQVTQANFPDTIQLGDVTKVFAKDLPKIDLLIGGSPCQGFSFAGKGLNFEDPRSKLFFEFVRLRKECNPKWFFLENVRMKYEHELVISKFMGVEPIEINSALLSAQNRQRLYWTNINEKPYGLFGELKPDIPQPKDKGMLLKHILETDVSDKYRLSEKAIAKILRRNWSKPQFEPLKTGAILPKNNSGQLSIDSGTTLIGCIKFGRTDEGKALRKESMARGKVIDRNKIPVRMPQPVEDFRAEEGATVYPSGQCIVE
jgi:DNA (cytosine-5)-methyltransferase 3A